ncbi:hypothetical protein [Streptomyces sp. NPDC057438]|uniref:hypothetical protein n=1 Tax=Streptomyces sp. NPDC057438 TaxID=3346133 RepID=UPI00367CA80A
MRLAHTAFGGLAAMAWLLLPTATEPAEGQPTGRHADMAPSRGSTVGTPRVPPAGGELFRVPSGSGTAVGPAADRGPATPAEPPDADGTAQSPDADGTAVGPAAGGQPTTPGRDEPSRSSARGVTTGGPRPPVRPAGPAWSPAPHPDGHPRGPDDDGRPGDPAAAAPLAPPAVGAHFPAPFAGAAAPVDDEASGADLILPVAAAGAAVVVAAYSLVRRRRRARLRTTPTGLFEPPTSPLPDLHLRARRLIVETDDSVRTSAEELRFAAARPGHVTAGPSPERPGGEDATEPHPDGPVSPADEGEPRPRQPHEGERPDADAVPSADDISATGSATDPHPEDPAAAESSQPPSEPAIALDPALAFAETPAGRDAVQPFVEALADARRELVGACRAGLRLEEERGALPPDEERALVEEVLTRCTTAQRRLDTATPAFDQLRSLEWDITPALECAETRFRELAARTAAAATTLTGLRETYVPAASLPVVGHVEQAKDRLVFATTELNRARQAAYPGDLRIAAVHLRAAEGAIDQADLFVTGVERLAAELAHATVTAARGARDAGPYDDPFDVLRGQDRWFLPAHSAVAAAADFITTHRAAVGAPARIRLSEAERHLTGAAPTDPAGPDGSADTTEGSRRAHTLAQEARHLAEQDVRAYGNPYGGPVGDGLAGALLGGIVLGEPPDGDGRADLRGPACYGGTATRARRTSGGQF